MTSLLITITTRIMNNISRIVANIITMLFSMGLGKLNPRTQNPEIKPSWVPSSPAGDACEAKSRLQTGITLLTKFWGPGVLQTSNPKS